MAAVRGDAQEADASKSLPRASSDRSSRAVPRATAAILAVTVPLAVMVAARTATGGDRDLLLSSSERAAQATAGTWSEIFDPTDLTNRAPVVFWVLALLLVGAIGLPYAWLAASSLPDRGYSVARPLGLVLIAWPAWLLASVGLAPFSRTMIAVVAGVVATGGAAIALARKEEFVAWLRASVRLIGVAESVFWSVFAAAVFVRWSNPDLWHPTLGGEKPMDFAFLNATIKSEAFPPYDPWFAGGYINYYYYGFVLVAVLVELTAIVPYVAYNLAVPTLAALLALAAFGAGLALAGTGARARRRPLLASGVLAAVFVAVVGNLAELEIVLRSITRSIPIEWWYWNASRAISHPPDEPGPITEFPAFTFLYADLHAHAIALPFTVAALVLLIAHVRAGGHDRGATVARLALTALLLGTLWVTNTWDFPTYAALILAALVLPAVVGRARRLPAAFSGAAVWLVIVCGAYLLFLPFHAHYLSTFAGVAVWHGSRTSLVDYLTIHGFFLFLIASALVVDLAQARDLNAVARAVRIAVRHPRRGLRLHRALVSPRPSYGAGLALLGVAVPGALALAVAGESVAALALVLGTLISLLIVRNTRRGLGPPRLWQATLLLALVALLLTVAVEYLVVAAIDIGRNNTVFKTYLQVWVFWGIAAAVATHRVYEQLPRLRLGWRVAWRTAFVALFSITLLYPFLATRAKIDDRFDPSIGRTLDGMAFMAKAVYTPRDEPLLLAHDLAAIRWMQNEIDGSPVVAEVNTYPVLYGWGNRYAMFTGNQAVIGWDFHERQQRGLAAPEAVPQRIADAQRLYETPDAREAHRILLRYGVDYVVVGSLERAFYPDGQEKWASGRGTLWDVAYRNPGVQIYRVRRGGTQ